MPSGESSLQVFWHAHAEVGGKRQRLAGLALVLVQKHVEEHWAGARIGRPIGCGNSSALTTDTGKFEFARAAIPGIVSPDESTSSKFRRSVDSESPQAFQPELGFGERLSPSGKPDPRQQIRCSGAVDRSRSPNSRAIRFANQRVGLQTPLRRAQARNFSMALEDHGLACRYLNEEPPGHARKLWSESTAAGLNWGRGLG
jgi:hypothetical protein